MSTARMVCILMVLCLSSAGFGQINKAPATVVATIAPQPPATRIEAAMARKGMILIRDVYSNIAELASVKGDVIRFSGVGVYEPNQEKTMAKAMRIAIIDTHGNTQRVFVDFDEIAAMIKAADKMAAAAIEWKGQIKEFAEMSYTTRADLKFGFFQRGLDQTAFVSIGENENCILKSVSDIKVIGENAAKCAAKVNEKQQKLIEEKQE